MKEIEFVCVKKKCQTFFAFFHKTIKTELINTKKYLLQQKKIFPKKVHLTKKFILNTPFELTRNFISFLHKYFSFFLFCSLKISLLLSPVTKLVCKCNFYLLILVF